MSRDTRKLGMNIQDATETAVPQDRVTDVGMQRPWRVALRIIQLDQELIFDVTGSMVVGRSNPDQGFYPDIDLGPYNAADSGVSREHLTISLDGERVVIRDNESANGTKINGEWLKPNEAYPIRHGDELTLGLMNLTFELLNDPADI